MGFNFTSGNSRIKKRPSGLKVPLSRFKTTSTSSPRTAASPTAAPFNSTSFLIRQKSQHRDEEDDSPAALDSPAVLEQYGSNMNIAMDDHDLAGYQSQPAQHRTMSSHDSSLLHLQLQLQGLQVTDRAEASTQILHQPSCIDSSSRVGLEDDQAFQHRRIRSFTDDNFDLLNFQSN